MSTALIDAVEVRRFLELISSHATKLVNGAKSSGFLNLCRISPLDSDKVLTSRFTVDDAEHMIEAALCDAERNNVYIEGRTVRPGLPASSRGDLKDTQCVFALVIDSDADKGKAGQINVRPSLVVETSPGNYHFWFFLSDAISAEQAKVIGDVMRAGSGADADTGVPSQPFRVAGTPNFPNKAKQARGRCTVEATRIVDQSGYLWEPDELLKAFSPPASTSNPAPSSPSTATSTPASTPPSLPGQPDESTLPPDLLADIRNGGIGRGNDKSRSGLFQSTVRKLRQRNWSVEDIVALFEKYPNGIGAKYDSKRLAAEVKRSYNKVNGGAAPSPQSPPPPPPPQGPVATPKPTPNPPPNPTPHVLPTIRLEGGQLPYTVRETERALLGAGTEIYARAGSLVYPVYNEVVAASDGRKTTRAKLAAFTPDSLIEPVAECAIFERYNIRKKEWTPVDPPPQLVRTLLAREKRWQFPQVSGIITTPTLRFDGSLLCTPGYDQRSELYLVSGLTLPPIPEKPSDAQALTGLDMLKDLFSEFSFQQAGLDCSVALAGLLTALLRGSLPTSPVCLVRGDGPGVGKSMLVDIIAMITTGRLCPVITMSKNLEETEKRIGAVLLSGSSMVSLDNITRDLEGELLCQLTERPIVRIRILGRSEMPDCECHTAVFATGNGVGFAGDMTRRGILCNLQALTERPELREFKRDTLAFAANNRGAYVAAALTIVRAYLSAGAPRICGPLGSYAAWSQMVRAPLIWLGEKDPVSSMDEIRAEDPQLAQVREFFQLWNDYRLDLNMPFTVARILELIDIAEPKGGLNPPGFREFLLKIARERHRAEVSPERFGWWLRRNAGRIVNGYRLIKGRDSVTKNTNYTLVKA